jgi:hypothetical protein
MNDKRSHLSVKRRFQFWLFRGSQKAATMSKDRNKPWHWLLGTLWLLLVILGIGIPLKLDPNRQRPLGIQPLGSLPIISQKGDRFVEWDRKDVIEFSLDQIDSSIKYLFIAATALLGFVVKILIDPLLDPKTGSKPIRPRSKLLLVHTAIGCLISISCGFLARSYFASLADSTGFSIYDEVGFAALGQLLAFLLAALLLVSATIYLVYQGE